MTRTLSLAICFLSAALPSGAVDLSGHWEGAATREEKSTPVILDLGAGGGTVGLPELEVLGIPVTFDANASTLIFEFRLNGMKHVFALSPAGGELNGSWSVNEPALELSVHLARVADSRPYTSEEIRFHSDVELAGTLFVPKSPGPHAGIALIHGSGDNERWWREYYADFFARRGLAVVFFDKRGNGDSGGNWHEVGFEPLARDGLAALDYMASRPDIRKDALGFWGISQAGWIMPLAATLSDRVSFIIVTSGATVNVEQEGYYDYMVKLQDEGYGEDIQQRMLAILKQDNYVTRTGQGYDELKAMVEPYRKEPWYRSMEFIPTPPHFVMRRFMRLIVDYDPKPNIEKLDVPVLWLYGDADKSVDAPRSMAILNDIMRQGDYAFTIRSFPNADHGITVPPRADAIIPERLRAPGYWDTIADWLDDQGLSPPQGE